MRTRQRLRNLVARVLMVMTTSALFPAQAHAEMIATEQAVSGERERILMVLDRPDLGAQLEAYGVKPGDVKARIAALSEAEVARLSAEIDKAHAGAGDLGALALPLMAVAFVLLLPFFILGALIVHGAGKHAAPAQNLAAEAPLPYPQ